MINSHRISIIAGITLAIMFFAAVQYSIAGDKDDSLNRFNLYGGNLPYLSPTPGEIPIIAIHPCLKDSRPTSENFRGVKECGFNAAIYFPYGKSLDTACFLAGQQNIRMIVGIQDIIRNHGVEYMKKYVDNPNITGWYLVDEPKYEVIDSVSKIYDDFLKVDSTRLVRVNLIGNVNPIFTGPCKGYTSYLDTIQRLFRPGVWSYDLYPFDLKKGAMKIQYDLFYYDLETYRKVSRVTGRPFWTPCQSMAFKSKYRDCPPATLQSLRFTNFSALAYGAQAVIYWTYSQRHSGKYETYLSALVNLDGTRTAAWYAAQQVNREIRLFTPVFLNSDVAEVCHSGSKRYRGTTPLKGEFGPIAKVSSEVVEREGDMAGGDDGFMFSHLKTGGKDYVVVVSHNPLAPQRLSLVFKPGARPVLMEPVKTKSGMKLREKRLRGTWQTEVEPGGYLVLRY